MNMPSECSVTLSADSYYIDDIHIKVHTCMVNGFVVCVVTHEFFSKKKKKKKKMQTHRNSTLNRNRKRMKEEKKATNKKNRTHKMKETKEKKERQTKTAITYDNKGQATLISYMTYQLIWKLSKKANLSSGFI